MKHSKLALITSVLGLSTATAASLNIFPGYHYQSSKSSQTDEQKLAAIKKAKAKAARRGVRHEAGKFAKA